MGVFIVVIVSIICYFSICHKAPVYPTVIIVEEALEVSYDSVQLGSAGLAFEDPALNNVDILNSSSDWES